MKRNYLLIVEGKETEPRLFSHILRRYGFNPIRAERQTSDGGIEYDSEELSDSISNVIIAQAERNRLEEIYKKISDNPSYYDFDHIFKSDDQEIKPYSGIFLIFDVDHTSNAVLESLCSRFSDETDGMLLVSSPCIEVISEPNRTEKLRIGEHISEYKKQMNIKYNGAVQYIIDHFESLIIRFIDQNRNEFQENNVIEHPHLVVDQINRMNVRNEDGSALYRYFTTVVYVAIAYMKGLTSRIDNYKDVRDFFESYAPELN